MSGSSTSSNNNTTTVSTEDQMLMKTGPGGKQSKKPVVCSTHQRPKPPSHVCVAYHLAFCRVAESDNLSMCVLSSVLGTGVGTSYSMGHPCAKNGSRKLHENLSV